MTVKGTVVDKTHIFEQGIVVQQMFDRRLCAGNSAMQGGAYPRQLIERGFQIPLSAQIPRFGANLRQVARHRPHAAGDRHLIVV